MGVRVKRLWVTGLDGFVGRAASDAVASMPDGAGVKLVIPDLPMELRDAQSVAHAVGQAQPDWVMHLAAQSFVPNSVADPRTTYDVNFFGTLNLLEALRAEGFAGRLLYVGSGDVYGRVDASSLPVGETQPLRPRNPYSVSKAAAELLCYQWSQRAGFDIVLARPFNHLGPGQAEWFVASDFAKQLAEIKRGRREPVVRVGSIDVTRDFTDVRDVVRAYFLLLAGGTNGEVYNVCSGREHSIRTILKRLIELAGL